MILLTPHLPVPGCQSEESLLLQAEVDEAADADLERPGDAGGEVEVGEVGGEAGAEHGVAALTVQDLVQLGLSEPNLQQTISGQYQGSNSLTGLRLSGTFIYYHDLIRLRSNKMLK